MKTITLPGGKICDYIDGKIDLMIDVSNIGECRRIHAARFVCIRLKEGTEKVVENTVPKVNGIGCKKLA